MLKATSGEENPQQDGGGCDRRWAFWAGRRGEERRGCSPLRLLPAHQAAGSTGSRVSRQRGAAAAACRPSCLREEHPRDGDEPQEASRGERGAPALLALFKGSPVLCGRKEAARGWEGARHPPAGRGWQGTAVTGRGGRVPCSDGWLRLASSSPHSLPRRSRPAWEQAALISAAASRR